MTLPIDRRGLALGLLASTIAPACPAVTVDGAGRLSDHADFWSRLPLPFTLAQAWNRLSPDTQAEIGTAVIGMTLADYIQGGDRAEEDQFSDSDLRAYADEVWHSILNTMPQRLWGLLPELYGPDGDHPRWALDGGLAR
nr:hypothetical protein NG677_04165 [Methylobacterium sp. OTU13CASTA1]